MRTIAHASDGSCDLEPPELAEMQSNTGMIEFLSLAGMACIDIPVSGPTA